MLKLRGLYDAAEALLGERLFKLVRYVTSGGAAALTNMTVLFLLVHFGHLYYLYASILAFLISVGVSFTMQKFWTFRDTHVHDIHTQFARYVLVIVANLILNTLLMYTLVEKAGVWYLSAQFFTVIAIAFVGYFAYRHFVFRERTVPLI